MFSNNNARYSLQVNPWLHGCMVAWLHGCMVAWLHVCICAECLLYVRLVVWYRCVVFRHLADA